MDLSEDAEPATAQLFVLSAYDQDGVSRVRDSYHDYLSTRSENTSDAAEEFRFLQDLSHTLASKRTHHAWRAFAIANSPGALKDGLREIPKPTRAKSEPRLAWVFTGQGAQWPAMGVELMVYPIFRESILAADRYLNDLGCLWSLSCKSLQLPEDRYYTDRRQTSCRRAQARRASMAQSSVSPSARHSRSRSSIY